MGKNKSLDNIQKDTIKKFKEKRIMVCAGTGCTSSKSQLVIDEINKELKKQKVDAICSKTGCFGFCAKGPIVVIEPEETFYELVQESDAYEIVHAIKTNSNVERLMPKEKGDFVKKWHQLNFYGKQKRIVLRNCGKINPESIDEYIAVDGYKAIEKVLKELLPKQVISIISKSGLRGRGGAGFPTGKKWELCSESKSEQKYVCCNADEGDPGAFMDRSILEGDPHSVIEGMMIAGYAVGANKGYIYVRAEYPIAVTRLNNAIKQAKEYGLLGNNILKSNFSFDVELRLGAGAFVCGEETSLIQSIEGKRGEPVERPPFPTVKGIYNKPTVINNVETLVNVPIIILKGQDWYNKIGTKTSKGTKVFALSGNINNVGLVEVPMGTTLRTIIEDIGGGIPNNRKFKIAQIGGPSGGCISEKDLDTKIDYESLIEKGSMMGSGGLIVMDDSKCMVNIAKYFLEFTVDESCGKCAPCRIGTKRMLEILIRITKGKGKQDDLETLQQLANTIKNASLCGLGQTAPNPVLSTIKNFKEEYEQHIKEKKCKTGECKELTTIKINNDVCKRCGICQKNCPVNAIEGNKEIGYTINQDKCIKCRVCIEKCPFNAIDG